MKNGEEQNAERERDVDAGLNPVQKYFMGDMKFLNDWLQDQPAIVQFPNWFLRGIGAPIFLNNPISGECFMGSACFYKYHGTFAETSLKEPALGANLKRWQSWVGERCMSEEPNLWQVVQWKDSEPKLFWVGRARRDPVSWNETT